MAKRKKATTIVIGLDLDAESEQIEAAAERFEKLGQFIEGFGATLAKLLTLPLTLLGAPALMASEALDEAADQIRLATGAAGESLDALMDTLHAVREETGAGIGQAQAALVEMVRGLGLQGESLQSATTALTRVAQATNGDAKVIANSVVSVMRAWGESAENAAATCARLHRAARTGGRGISDVSAALSGAAPTLKAAGLSLGESAVAIEDLGRRGLSIEDGLGALTKAVTELARSGSRDIPTALRQSIQAIRSAENEADAARMSADLFGKQGVAMADAIRRGALDLDAIKAAASKVPEPEPVERLSIAFGKLRAAVEKLLAPIGAAIARVIVLASGPILAVAKAVAEAARWFGALPDGVQSAIIVVGMLAALAGPAVALAGAGMSFVGALGFSSATLGRLGFAALVGALVSAGVGYATAGREIEKAAEKATAANPAQDVQRVSESIGHLGRSVESAARDVATGSSIPFVPAPRIEPMPRFQFAIPPMRPLLTPSLDSKPLNLPNIDVPDIPVPMPHIPMPSLSMPAAYDWQGDFESAMRNAPGVQRPPLPMEWPSFLPKPGEDFGAAMRAHSTKVQDWWTAMQAAGIMPTAPLMPGSWLDANRPEEWARRAAEVEDILRRNRMRDEFHMQMSERRNQLEIEQWTRNQEALKASPYGSNKYGLAQVPMGPASLFTAEDVVGAVKNGLSEAGWNSSTVPAVTPPDVQTTTSPPPTVSAGVGSRPPVKSAPSGIAPPPQLIPAPTSATPAQNDPGAARIGAPGSAVVKLRERRQDPTSARRGSA